jgi:hypothetical protein
MSEFRQKYFDPDRVHWDSFALGYYAGVVTLGAMMGLMMFGLRMFG